MKIDLSSIDREKFNVDERYIEGYGTVVLVVSSKLKHVWEDHELHLRSLLCKPDGTIVSSGFPKFMNYGERPDLDVMTANLIENGVVYYPTKMDGSLIIRDVLTGEDGEKFVHFRTRGSHDLGDFYGPVMTIVREKYLELLNPERSCGVSMLFEYTSPTNRIIIKYSDAELTLLGGMKLDIEGSLPLFIWGTISENHSVAQTFDVNRLEFHELPANTKELVKIVKAWPDSEGIVAWCVTGDTVPYTLPGGPYTTTVEFDVIHMAKIKAWDYIRLHSLKYAFSGKKLARLCYAGGIEDIDGLKEALFSFGVDWETVTLFRPDFEVYINTRKEREREIRDFIKKYRNSGIMEYQTRKEIAISTKEYCSAQGRRDLFGVCMSLAVGDDSKVRRAVEAYSLGISPASLEHFREAGQSLLDGLKPFMEMLEEREHGYQD